MERPMTPNPIFSGANATTRLNFARGFSLIELLIVVAIIMIIAAISIPNLLRSRMAANEASAVGSVRTINTAAIEYQGIYGAGYPASLKIVGTTGPTTSCNNAQLIDSVLTGGTKAGYNFEIVPGTKDVPSTSVPQGCTAGFSDGYVITATPQTVGTTGQRAFCSDATGVIRSNPTGTAVYTSPLCDASQTPLQ
jgi:prepilin-type N-terminal cleavage/methylation domain-containing protein